MGKKRLILLSIKLKNNTSADLTTTCVCAWWKDKTAVATGLYVKMAELHTP